TSSLVLATAVIANSNALSLSLPWKPGGGALVLTARGQWLFESYQSYYPGTDVSDLGFNEIRAGLDVQWKFLPRTSATFHGGFFTRLPDVSNRPDDTSGVEFMAGVNGLVTPHVGVSLKAGYGGTVNATPNYSTFLADIAAEWLPIEGASVSVGYSRGFGLDPIASSFGTDSAHVTGRIRMAQRYSFRTTVRYDHLSFDHLPSASGHTDGTSAFWRIEPGVDAAVSKWMTATLAYAYSSRASSFPADVPMFDYSKNEVWLKLSFTY
ncbi:MAG TPA: hypothetical protein VLT61_10115, partial [Anaeromyxobacteraceae bacterium]|nr:hypothetical protein [Anaeromyxobacteraceae bacterium]